MYVLTLQGSNRQAQGVLPSHRQGRQGPHHLRRLARLRLPAHRREGGTALTWSEALLWLFHRHCSSTDDFLWTTDDWTTDPDWDWSWTNWFQHWIFCNLLFSNVLATLEANTERSTAATWLELNFQGGSINIGGGQTWASQFRGHSTLISNFSMRPPFLCKIFDPTRLNSNRLKFWDLRLIQPMPGGG